MALKEVFQHSIALSDIDPELTGVTRKQVWDALKTAYLNRHEYLDFFLDSKPLKSETVGEKEKIDLEIKLSGQNGGQTIVEHHELDPEKSITTTIDATAAGAESQLRIVLEEASEGYALSFTYSQNLDETQPEPSPEEKGIPSVLIPSLGLEGRRGVQGHRGPAGQRYERCLRPIKVLKSTEGAAMRPLLHSIPNNFRIRSCRPNQWRASESSDRVSI